MKFNDYEVWSRDEFTKYILSKRRVPTERIDKTWRKLSKGYNFVIALYRKNLEDYDLYSVEYINKLFNKEKEDVESTTIKEDDIEIMDISLEMNSIYADVGIVDISISGLKVSFKYKSLNGNIFIETDRLLTIKEVKEKIISRRNSNVV